PSHGGPEHGPFPNPPPPGATSATSRVVPSRFPIQEAQHRVTLLPRGGLRHAPGWGQIPCPSVLEVFPAIALEDAVLETYIAGFNVEWCQEPCQPGLAQATAFVALSPRRIFMRHESVHQTLASHPKRVMVVETSFDIGKQYHSLRIITPRSGSQQSNQTLSGLFGPLATGAVGD